MNYDEFPMQTYTRYSREEMIAFNRAHSRNSRMIFAALFVLNAVMIGFAAIMQGRHFRFGEFIGDITLSLIIMIFTAISYLALNGNFYTEKKHAEAMKLLANGQYFTFANNDFIVGNEIRQYSGQSRMAYSMLSSVLETRDMFYLYISKRQAYLVSKQGFQTGSPGELAAVLHSHIPSGKYKVI